MDLKHCMAPPKRHIMQLGQFEIPEGTLRGMAI